MTAASIPHLNCVSLFLSFRSPKYLPERWFCRFRCRNRVFKMRSLCVDLDSLFHMFFLARFYKLLEENSFRGRTANFFDMFFGATVLTGIVLTGRMIPYVSESFAKIIFLSNSLIFMMVYVWRKQNPYIHMRFLGLFTFTAAYSPWVLLGFSVLVGPSAWVDLLGMIAGHAYYFL